MASQKPLLSRAVKLAAAYALALVATAFFAFPVFWMASSSVKSELDISQYPPVWSFTPTFENYAKLASELDAFDAFVNSAVIVGLATTLAMVCGTMAAYALARFDVKGKEIIAFEVLSIRMLPPIVSVIPMFIIARALGIFDTYWLLAAAYGLAGLPFVVWVMRVFIQDIPQSIEEAAMIDGCSRFQTFWRVTLPLLLPGLAATMVIVFMFAWNEFLLASMLTSQNAKTLPVIAANAIKPKAIAWGLASAAGVVMSLPVVVLVLMMQRYLVRGLTLGAVKG
ncbi:MULTISPECIES: carbohydrate ABC transporter permease [Paracoccus]|uniref:Carbohydrate ABC transporter membrane protein 2 (CUT1 family) n=1 Tax=Paracoccus versutus TaxID=34007 RepID=A0A369U0N9_PARVE|nr:MULTISPECIES: carbohydrate ABC transporter permease [Paracoccus]RDD68766.1 carbohydrate ABC transporter permease [Paracoccus versutus]REF73173.1 carbohydrate ABC transporter membrane protein 2 (CUT1 family) [Paracoccus versutus]WGR54928.1 carbohydrate ABC transporter permease [Paracoccus versutus]